MILTSLLAVLLSVPSSVLTVPIFSVPQTEAATLSKSELIDIATDIARAHHLNVDHFLKTVDCESRWIVDAVGDAGHSHGLVQIYQPAHTDITIEQANNPRFALMWMAREWQNDHAYWWTCWRIISSASAYTAAQ